MRRWLRVPIGCVLVTMCSLLGCEAVPSPMPPAVESFSETAAPSQISYFPATPTATPTIDLTPSPTPLPPTATSTVSGTATPTICPGFMWAHGTVAPEVVEQAQEAMESAGLEGTVGIGTFGETDTCGRHYGAKEVDFSFIVQVKTLETGADVARNLAILHEIALRLQSASHAPSIGRLRATFKTTTFECAWIFEGGAWALSPATSGNGTGCQLRPDDLTATQATGTSLTQ